jgi:glyoxylase-like metal-dependent hydrolase (beta-lactamase superfamily II)
MMREEVAPGIHRLEENLDGRILTVTLIVSDHGALLVDTGVATTPLRTVAPALRELGIEPRQLRTVLATHADIDHSGGLAEALRLAPEAHVLCHRLDVALVERVETLLDQRYREFRQEHDIDQGIDFCDWVRANGEDARVDLALVGGERLSVDERSLEVLHTPGHTRGHVALVDPASSTAVIGDAALGAALPGADGAPAFAPTYRYVAEYRSSLAALADLDLSCVVTGHLPVLRGQAIESFLAESADFCDRLENAILSALSAAAAPCTAREVMVLAAPAVRTWPEEADATLAQPVIGHLEELTARGVIRRVDGHPVRWELSR